MRELSLHILDLAQNSLAAGATLITIKISESPSNNLLSIEISDNGKGIEPERLQDVVNPFYTTRYSRKVGLGLSLFRAAAERSGGSFNLNSRIGVGTEVVADFKYDDIDRAPLGNIADTIITLVIANPETEFYYYHQYEDRIFTFDTRELSRNILRSELGIPIIANQLGQYLKDAVAELRQAN